MTLCAAALCDHGSQSGAKIVAICDRMITAGDSQAEIEQTKMWKLADSILFFVSGDIDAQSEAWSRFLLARPHEPQSIAQIANDYAKECVEVHARRLESHVRKWTGQGLAEMMKISSPPAFDWLSDKIKDFEPPEMDTLIVGLDNNDIEAHIYAIRDGVVSCEDNNGCAAIGSGSPHADAEFMLAGHTMFAPFSRTQVVTYLAKKRAEVNPFVGRGTYMFIIDRQMEGISKRLEQSEIDGVFEPLYKEYQACERALLDRFK